MNKEYMIQWLKDHKACTGGFEWAVQYCSSLEELWNTARPDWLIWVATRKGVLTDRELHEFALYCAEAVRHLMTDERSLNALGVKRRWLDGKATDEELKEAWLDAESAAWATTLAKGAATKAAYSASESAEWAAVCASTEENARLIAWLLAREAEKATRASQAKWLRDNCKPTFRG